MKALIITGSRKGIGRYLTEYYHDKGYYIFGCSRSDIDYTLENNKHFCLDVSDEKAVKQMFKEIRNSEHELYGVINNAGIASMNHTLLTPIETVEKIYKTNLFGSFLFSREAAKALKKNKKGRIINFATVATPLKLEGEAIYASSKAAIVSLTEVMAREVADYGITVNAVGPTPVKTDLIRSVPKDKMDSLLARQSINRFGTFEDISNVIDFYLQESSDFITGQVVYLGGV